MKKSFWIFVMLLSFAVLLVEYDVARRSARLAEFANQNSDTQAAYLPNRQLGESESFEQKFQKLAAANSNLSEAPEDTDGKIQNLSKNLSIDEIQHLAKVMSDQKAKEPQRSMAVELMARHQSVESLKQLEDFVLRPTTGTKNIRIELETVLRAQAIEGIAAYPKKELAISALTSLDPKVNETFLKDRIKRSVASLQNQVENSKSTTEQSLKNLVE